MKVFKIEISIIFADVNKLYVIYLNNRRNLRLKTSYQSTNPQNPITVPHECVGGNHFITLLLWYKGVDCRH